jgi:FdhE protein
MNTEVRIPEPGQIEVPADQIHFLFLPGRDLFARRAERFRLLSDCHLLEGYFVFLALLSDAQQKVLDQFPAVALPDTNEKDMCSRHRVPLLGYHSWPRDPAWQWGLKMILLHMKEVDLPPAAAETIAGLIQMSESGLEERADRILAGDLVNMLPQELPFIAAALQVYWAHMASSLEESSFGRLEQGGLCPVCGSYPNVGIVRGAAGAGKGLRYLSCSLCASQWHMVRIKCSSCESTRSINFYTMEGSNGAVKAESCDDCNFYLKLLYLEKDSQFEAMADDLATLSLDMLMDKEGKSRRGPNLFFHPGMSR